MKKLQLSFLFCIIVLLFSSCTNDKENEQKIQSETRVALGTVCTITLYDGGTQEVYDTLFLRLDEIEAAMSVNIQESEISRVNALSGLEKVSVTQDTYNVLKTALEYADLTNGAFNPAIGPLVKIWAIGTDNPRVPTSDEITEAINLSNYKHVLLSEHNGEYDVFLEQKGMALDLGGIAKGYAADEVSKILFEMGVERAIIDLGGNIYAFGEKENKDPWRVGIKNPFNSTGNPAIRLDIKSTSVVTSGVYERFFEQNGKRYHHLFDSSTGLPVNNGIMSVSIVTQSSMLADVLSTAVFVLGKDDGMQLLKSLDKQGLYIDTEKLIHSTDTLRPNITVLDSEFTLVQ